jgi:hypothetical protein
MNEEEVKRRVGRPVWPQHLVEPQEAEGHLSANLTVYHQAGVLPSYASVLPRYSVIEVVDASIQDLIGRMNSCLADGIKNF